MSSIAIFLDQCRDIQILYHDKVLSSDFLYVSTLTSLSQHLLVNFSHVMLRQSCEMSRKTLFLASIQLDLCYDIASIGSFGIMSQYFETMSLQRFLPWPIFLIFLL